MRDDKRPNGTQRLRLKDQPRMKRLPSSFWDAGLDIDIPALKADRDFLDIKDPNATEYMASVERLGDKVSFTQPLADRSPEMLNTNLYSDKAQGDDAFKRAADKVSYAPDKELSMGSGSDGFGDIDYGTAAMFASAVEDLAARSGKSDLAQYDAIAKAFGVKSDLAGGFDRNIGGFNPFEFATRAKALNEMFADRDATEVARARFGRAASEGREEQLSKSESQIDRFNRLTKGLY